MKYNKEEVGLKEGGGGGGGVFTFLPCIVRLIRKRGLLERESSIEDLQ